MDDRTPSEEIEDVDWAIDDEVVGLVDVLQLQLQLFNRRRRGL